MNNIKTVYALMESNGYEVEVEGIFSTKELAEKYRAEFDKNKIEFFHHYYIVEHILDYGQ